MLHHDMMLAFYTLGMMRKSKEQCRHFYFEMKNMDKTNFAVIKKTGAIVSVGQVARVQVPDVNANMTDEQKHAACKAILDVWRKWEESTVALYNQELASDPTNTWLAKLKTAAESEIARLSRIDVVSPSYR
jgi:hypothetical protein